ATASAPRAITPQIFHRRRRNIHGDAPAMSAQPMTPIHAGLPRSSSRSKIHAPLRAIAKHASITQSDPSIRCVPAHGHTWESIAPITPIGRATIDRGGTTITLGRGEKIGTPPKFHTRNGAVAKVETIETSKAEAVQNN